MKEDFEFKVDDSGIVIGKTVTSEVICATRDYMINQCKKANKDHMGLYWISGKEPVRLTLTIGEFDFSKWIFDPNAVDLNIGGYICFVCKCRNDNLPNKEVENPFEFLGSKYCPNCGRKMVKGLV